VHDDDVDVFDVDDDDDDDDYQYYVTPIKMYTQLYRNCRIPYSRFNLRLL